MTRLNLARRKIARRRKMQIILWFWNSVLIAINWFFQVITKAVQRHNKDVSLRAIYDNNFYKGRRAIYDLVYESDVTCLDQLRMTRQAFTKLCSMFQTTGKLKPTKNMLLDEQVATTGKETQTPADVVEELDMEDANEPVPIGAGAEYVHGYMSSMQSPRDEEMSSASARGRKRNRNSDGFGENIREAAVALGQAIRESANTLKEAMMADVVATKREMINGELLKISSLSVTERIKCAVLIGKDQHLIDIFFTFNDDEKEEFVRGVLRGDWDN